MSHSKSSVIDHQFTSSATHDLLASVAFKRIGPTLSYTILKRPPASGELAQADQRELDLGGPGRKN
jgi:hypothetical protein